MLLPVVQPLGDEVRVHMKVVKDLQLKVAYSTKVHEEDLLERRPTLIEQQTEHALDAFKRDGILNGTITTAITVVALPLEMLVGTKARKQTQQQQVPNSARQVISYQIEGETVPAVGEHVRSNDLNQVSVTNAAGIATFVESSSAFDGEVEFFHVESGSLYGVRRIKTFSTTVAPWNKPVKDALHLIGGARALKEVYHLVKIGAGPKAYIVAAVVELGTHLVVGFIIDVASTQTEEHTQWLVINKSV